jgi:hypothetical protein
MPKECEFDLEFSKNFEPTVFGGVINAGVGKMEF